VFQLIFEGQERELEERETWDCKGGNFRLEGLFSEVLLGWETLYTPFGE